MYTKAKLSVSLTAEAESDYFPCNIGARQGEHLSPLLFSIYLQDLKSFISRKCNGLKHIENMQKNILMGKLWHTVNLYADGTVILAGNPNDLQASLNEMEKNCDTFNLHINANKTKIVFFSRRILRKHHINFGEHILDTVDEYNYLGLVFHYNDKIAFISEKMKAMFSLLKKLEIDLFCWI